MGIGSLLRSALLSEGLGSDEAKVRQLFVDTQGIVLADRAGLEPHKREIGWSRELLAAARLGEPVPVALDKIIEAFKPTVLIGTTGQPGIFTPVVLRAMASVCDRPIILPLSNPTSKADCTPADAVQHSDGRAIVAAGSPCQPVEFAGKTHIIGQCNNAFIFPGVGLGALLSEASHVPDSLFRVAAHTLAEFTTTQAGWDGALYPGMRHLRSLSEVIGFKVAQTARDEGFGQALDDDALTAALEKFIWFPEYHARPRSNREKKRRLRK